MLGFVSGGVLHWMHQDHIGRPRMVASQNGDVQWKTSWQPFGRILTGKTSGTVPTELRFPGQYWDWESGLAYNGFRDYDYTSGRYAQSDPIGLRGGWNTYAYVGGNPVMRVDPSGSRAVCMPGNMDMARCGPGGGGKIFGPGGGGGGGGGVLALLTWLLLDGNAQQGESYCGDDCIRTGYLNEPDFQRRFKNGPFETLGVLECYYQCPRGPRTKKYTMRDTQPGNAWPILSEKRIDELCPLRVQEMFFY